MYTVQAYAPFAQRRGPGLKGAQKGPGKTQGRLAELGEKRRREDKSGEKKKNPSEFGVTGYIHFFRANIFGAPSLFVLSLVCLGPSI